MNLLPRLWKELALMVFIYVISLSMSSSSRLGFIMNDTAQTSDNDFPQCIVLFGTNDANAKNIMLTIIYGTLILSIIGVNFLLILEYPKRNSKFTSSQILFLTLFLNDLTFGVVQLPIQVYLLWKSREPICLEVQISAFSMAFPVCMSGSILCVITIDRYLTVVHNRFCKRIVTKKSLIVPISLVVLTSLLWATLDELFRTPDSTKKLAITYIALSGYAGTVLGFNGILNVSLLGNVKRKTRKSFVHQKIDSSLTKTKSLILALMLLTYFPAIATINVAAYALISSNDKQFILQEANDFIWALIPIQINAVLNSIIYFTRNSRMRNYHYKLFTSANEERNLKSAELFDQKNTLDSCN